MGIFDERKAYKPFIYGNITDPLIDAMWAGHWTHNEFNFASDQQDFKTKLTLEEQGVIKRAVLLISQLEVAIKSYWANIGKLLPHPEIADMGAVFGGVEVIHSRAYSEILTRLGLNDEFGNILEEPVVKNRVNYLTKYLNKIYKNDRKNICYSLILFTIFTENTSLFSQFYTILGFNRFKNVLKDIANVVQYTSKEEALHAEGGIQLVNIIREEYPDLIDNDLKERVHSEALEAYNSEVELIKWILQGYENEFLSVELLSTYLKKRFNDSLSRMGFHKIFKPNKDLVEKTTWMDEEILASSLTDFFHKKPIDYTKKMKSYSESELF